ncbi:IniB N-terminal domain-containing protein [Pseudonocardia cypriaca]|uniref:Uncharacterized protein n=1 Tax=Pseudonocardia cypriaca TaxID=882449 RepID=A0A543FPY4_9PSEU|nr:IniB N-terminal domain-containing protein [Pseudonocardia cypriaca]TQM35882.1 hypothetical protein FB388_7327 [Pseudonocardia cypriaca]
MTLLEFLRSLIFDDEARQEFADDPEGALDDAGLGHLSAEDVRDALDIIQDDGQDADFSRDYNTGGNEIHIAAPSPVHDDDSAADYINRYITNNYITNEGDTITDNSTNIQADTGGGDFNADIDVDSVVASGDGAVAAGDDIEDSTITSGDDNTIGDNNIEGNGNTSISGDGNEAVIGNGNTASFGDGDASSTDIDGDVNVDDGSSFAIGGSSSVDNSNYEDNDTEIDASDNSVNDSFNNTADIEDNDSYSHYEDNSDHSRSEDNDSESTDSHDHSDVSIQA